jgi:16S rRNA (guanine527-N7)-methyltransferase
VARPANRQAAPGALDSDRAKALALTPVSRETLARLDRFVALLLKWQATTQLIGASTVPTLWTRHVADSLQLLDLAPQARTWADMGSGAGFPGLVIACAIADRSGAKVHLIESNARKAAFLREAVAVTAVPAVVHAIRMEKFVESGEGPIEAVTARAVCPLDLLLAECHPLLRAGAVGLFPKGQDVASELTKATRYWKIAAELVPSKTNPVARIVVVRALERQPRVT